jgi:hypothetical protein
MSIDMKGGGWKGGDEEDGYKDTLDYIKQFGKNGIVLDGIVLWITIQEKGTADNIWKAQADAKFLEEEVQEAKDNLWKACEDSIGYAAPKRQGDNKKKADLDDIHKALTKLTCANALPLVLASNGMVAKVPAYCINPDQSNVTNVLNKMKVLETSMDSFMKQQAGEMRILKEAIGAVGQGCSYSSQGMESQKPMNHVDRVKIREEVFESPSKRKRMGDQADSNRMDVDSTRMEGNIGPENQANSYAAMAGITPIQNQREQQSRPRRKSALIYGKSKNVNDDEVYLAANVNLVASGVSKDATANQLTDFLKQKGLDTVAIEKLTQHPDARTNTFKVTIAPADYENALNPDIWPYRVAIRHFKPKRFTSQNSWQQQSQQTGGYVQERPQQHRQ